MLKEFIHELLDLDLEKTRLEQENNNLKELLEFIKETISKNATRVRCTRKDEYIFDINYENVGRDICKKFTVNGVTMEIKIGQIWFDNQTKDKYVVIGYVESSKDFVLFNQITKGIRLVDENYSCQQLELIGESQVSIEDLFKVKE